MLLRFLLLLAVASPFAIGALQGNSIERRTGDDAKDKGLSAGPAQLPSNDELSVPVVISTMISSSLKDDKVVSPSHKESNLPALAVLSVNEVSSPLVTTNGKSTLASNKDRQTLTLTPLQNVTSTSISVSKDETTPILLVSVQSSDTAPKDVKASTITISKDDQSSSLPSKDRGFFTSIPYEGAKVSSALNNDKSVAASFQSSIDGSTSPQSAFNKDNKSLPLVIVYSLTVPLGSAPSANILQTPNKPEVGPSSTASQPTTRNFYLNSPSLTVISLESVSKSEFVGYNIVASPTTAPSEDYQSGGSSAVIPVYTPALLGNAYGGGFVARPSLWVSKRPFPYGPSEGVPPGYGSYSQPQITLSFAPVPSIITDKNRTLALSIASGTKPSKDQTPEVETLAHATSTLFNPSKKLGNPEITFKSVTASISVPLIIETSVSGKTELVTDKKTSTEIAHATADLTEIVPFVYRTTEKVLTTTTYRPVTTISGIASTLSSTTLTKTFVTVNVILVTQASTNSAGTEQNASTITSSTSFTGSPEVVANLSNIYSAAISETADHVKFATFTSKKAGVQEAPSMNSKFVVSTLAQHESPVLVTSSVKSEFGSALRTQSSSSHTQISYATTTKASSLLKPTESLDSPSPYSETKKSETSLPSRVIFNTSITQPAPVTGSGTGGPILSLLISELLSHPGTFGARLPTTAAIPSPLISEVSLPLNSSEVFRPTKTIPMGSVVSELSPTSAPTRTAFPVPLFSGLSSANIYTESAGLTLLVSELSSLLISSGIATARKPAILGSQESAVSSRIVGFGVSATPHVSIVSVPTPVASLVSSATSLENATSDSIKIGYVSSVTEMGSFDNALLAINTPTLGYLSASVSQTANGASSFESGAVTPVAVPTISASLGSTAITSTELPSRSVSTFPVTALPAIIPILSASGQSPPESATLVADEAFSVEGPPGISSVTLQGSTPSSMLVSSSFLAAESGTSAERSESIPPTPSEASGTPGAAQSINGVSGSSLVAVSSMTLAETGIAESTSSTLNRIPVTTSKGGSETLPRPVSFVSVPDTSHIVAPGPTLDSVGGLGLASSLFVGSRPTSSSELPGSIGGQKLAIGASMSVKAEILSGAHGSTGESGSAVNSSVGIHAAIQIIGRPPATTLTKFEASSFDFGTINSAQVSQKGAASVRVPMSSSAASLEAGKVAALAGALSGSATFESPGVSLATLPATSGAINALASSGEIRPTSESLDSSGALLVVSPAVSKGASALLTLITITPSPAPIESMVVSKAVSNLNSPASTIIVAALETSTAQLARANRSNFNTESSVSITRSESSGKIISSNVTKASISVSTSSIGNKGGNDSVSINLRPTAVLPFQGAGVRLSATFRLSLRAFLATLFFI